jgi:hypothetical protein
VRDSPLLLLLSIPFQNNGRREERREEKREGGKKLQYDH